MVTDTPGVTLVAMLVVVAVGAVNVVMCGDAVTAVNVVVCGDAVTAVNVVFAAEAPDGDQSL